MSIDAWGAFDLERQEARDLATIAATILQAAQLFIYYDLWKDEIDDRDDMIDRDEVIRNDLHRRDIDVDIPRLKLKQDALGIPLPEPNLCGDSVLCANESELDGQAIDSKANQMAMQSCGGIPDNWGIHEGTLYGARAGAYAGGILSNAGKRRLEGFRKSKTSLVLAAQQSARLDIGPVLQSLGQAAAIHSGLADIWLQGFNSAGASLGVLAGRLANGSGTSSTGGGVVSSNGGGAGPFATAGQFGTI